MMIRVLVSGDRNWNSFGVVYNVLRDCKYLYGPDVLVIHGDAKGADLAAKQAATKLELEAMAYPARWSLQGNSAGHIRNHKMVDKNPNIRVGLLFHDFIKNSKGTAGMMEILDRARVPWVLYNSSGKVEATSMGDREKEEFITTREFK